MLTTDPTTFPWFWGFVVAGLLLLLLLLLWLWLSLSIIVVAVVVVVVVVVVVFVVAAFAAAVALAYRTDPGPSLFNPRSQQRAYGVAASCC